MTDEDRNMLVEMRSDITTLKDMVKDVQDAVDLIEAKDGGTRRTSGIVLRMVSELLHVPIDVMRGKTRPIEVVEARWVVMYLLKEHCGYEKRRIASVFRMTPSNIVHSLDKVDELIRIDKKFRQKIEKADALFEKEFKTEDEDETK